MNEYRKLIKRFASRLPKFPDGRIDYSGSAVAPVVTVFVRYRNKILLLKRSDKVLTYRGLWNTVAGFLDEIKPLKDKVLDELREELGLRPENIITIKFGKNFKLIDKKIAKTWLVFPVVAELKRLPKIKLNWEHSTYRWVEPGKLKDYNIVPQLERSCKYAHIGSV